MRNIDIKIVVAIIISYLFLSFVTTTIDDFFMPGSQPLQSGTFKSPTQCDNCHGGYDVNAEPAFTWRGSMMANAMRDPLYLASLTIANQDAVDAGDLCIRCHSPSGWLEGRSVPTDGSGLNTAIDQEGVHCHFCHKMIDPLNQNPNQEDSDYLATLTLNNNIPTQHGNGMFVVDSDDIRRGPYDDANANHSVLYSEFMIESEMCAACHDVSNPVFSKVIATDGSISYEPNELGAITDDFDKYEMFPVERTYSEWKMSAYNSPEGIPSSVFGGNKTNVATCQDCHMKDVTGKGVNKNSAPIRYDLGQHDMTGGNTFIPELIKTQALPGIDTDAIDAGILRARYMLENAASMYLDVVAVEDGSYNAIVEIVNETGHKLPSGYPEGRRMWINLEAYDSNDNVIWESGAYDSDNAILSKQGSDNNETKIYECKLGMSSNMEAASGSSNYEDGSSFHFALNNVVVKDNRIPPRGFTNANFESIQASPVGYAYEDGAFSDKTTYNLPSITVKVEAKLYYQTVSKEYIEFLDSENVTDTKGAELKTLWENHGKSTPELMKEVEFDIGTSPTLIVSAKDGKWSEDDTWVGDEVPRSIDNVQIDHTVNVNVDATINHVTITDNQQLIINKTKSLVINGDLVSDAYSKLLIDGDSNQFGSIIINGGSGMAEIRRFVKASPINDLVSPPLKIGTFELMIDASPNLYENPVNLGEYAFGPFDNTSGNGSYINYNLTDNATTPLVSGKGYRASTNPDNEGIITFKGEIPTTQVDISITDPNGGSRWNLIGNPYPSYLNFGNFFDLLIDKTNGAPGSNTQLAIGFNAIYGYDGDNTDGSKWTVWDLNTDYENYKITPGQGFFVNSKPDGGLVSFTPSMRIIGTTDDFIANKSVSSNVIKATFKLNNGDNVFNTNLYFREGNTRGLDNGYDTAAYLGNADGIFTNLVEDHSGLELYNQSLNSSDIYDVIVPLGIKANAGEQISISLNMETTNIPSNIFVYLEDNVANSWTLLNDSDYTFTPTTTLDVTGRFFIHFQTDTLVTPVVENSGLQIIVNQDYKTVIINGLLFNDTSLRVYDINGREIINRKLTANSTVNPIDVSNLNTGIYIVKLENIQQQRTHRVIIK